MAKIARQFSTVWVALALTVVLGLTSWGSSGHPSVAAVLLLVLMFGIGVGAMQMRLASLARSLRRIPVRAQRRGPQSSK